MNRRLFQKSFVEKIKNQLTEKLPGLDAHLKMSVKTREQRSIPTGVVPRKSAVLVLMYPFQQQWFIPFIQRPRYNGVHSGQMAFPGGKYEEGDKHLVMTAQREAEEEVGIPYEKVEILGQMSDLYIPPSNMMVRPVLAYSTERPRFVLDPVEVDQLVEVPLLDFFDPANRKDVDVQVGERLRIQAPAYVVKEKVIWGATAMMMSELIEVLSTVIDG
ncbi:CoA pyrophosphatase [Rapidithrix thailandica]|uniref:CoA pyrophosphatase n=1 Tax=Rapidithrix thailandica TaxID=413964 RepID=A0AAW9SA96_9BACT